MQKLLVIGIILLGSTFWGDGIGKAQTKVYIPDNNFRNFLNNNYPSFMDGTGDSLIIASAATLTGNLACNNLGIGDLSGVQYFTNITGLICSSNQLTSLPALDSLGALKLLYCSYNQLTALPDLSGNPALVTLECYYNQLTTLPNLSANTALTNLICAGNELTVLPDLSANTTLVELSCNLNQLTSLPSLSANIALRELGVGFNLLTNIPDLSANTALELIDVRGNQLTALADLSTNVALTSLSCSSNLITTLPNLTTNTSLAILRCDRNQLTVLPDLFNNTSLEELWCDSNLLTVLPDLSNNTALKKLLFNYNDITVIPDLSTNTALETIQAYDNELTSLPDLSANTMLQTRDFRNNRLDFSDARELRISEAVNPGVLFEIQKPFGLASTYNLAPGDTLTLSIAGQDSALSYQWFRGTDTIVSATDTQLIITNVAITDSGTYTCRSYGTALLNPPMVYSLGEFVSESMIVTVSTVNVEETAFLSEISVYPNPSSGYITVEIDGASRENTELRIVNMLGEEVYQANLRHNHGIFQQHIDLSHCAKGIYCLSLASEAGTQTIRIIIQ